MARIFCKIVEDLQAQAVRLNAQVEQLRVDIDHNKKEAEVQAITESDFFRDLKSKSKIIRQQRQVKSKE